MAVDPEAIAEPRTRESATAAALAAATGRLERAAVEGARLDAELLMAAAAHTSRAAVIVGARTDVMASAMSTSTPPSVLRSSSRSSRIRR